MGILRPQIFTNERALSSFASPAGERIAAMIGTAMWGPMSTATTVSNLSEFVSVFGTDSATLTLSGIKGADLFFRNGGTLKFVRIEDGDADFATKTFVDGVTDQLDVTAKYKGTYGNNIKVTFSANAINASYIDVTITDGTRTELFTNSGQGYETTDDIVAAVNDSTSGSVLVEMELNTSGDGDNLPDVASEYLVGGDDGENGTLTTAITTAFDDVLVGEAFNYLLIPGCSTDATHLSLVGKLNIRDAQEKLYSRLITGIALNETISTALARTATGKRITVVAPNVKYVNSADNSDEILDGSYLACAYAGLLCRLPLQISGTHETISVAGLSVNSTTGKEYYTKAEQEQLLQGKILPIAKIGSSIQCVRGITRETSTSSIYFEEVVTDITDYIRSSCESYFEGTIGKPNTIARRAVWASGIDTILDTARVNEVIQDYTATSIIEGSSPDTFIATVTFKPAYSVNFVILNINVQ